MFVCVARLTLDIPAAGSLKARRQVLRRVTDRVKAKFNVAVAEVDDEGLHNRAVVALAVVSNDRRHANEMMDKIVHFIDDMYVAPIASRELELLSFGEDLFTGPSDLGGGLMIPRGERSLAEAEGLGDWEDRHRAQPAPSAPRPSTPPNGNGKKPRPQPSAPRMSLEEARAVARSLRNRRDWEKKEKEKEKERGDG
jgi:uncharacterized protein YlxP (DUF503 family)